jgi:ribosomally synthesized peptide (two-chain TOMM family)
MPRNNRLPTYESLLEFQEVYLRAVALAWNDVRFKSAFLAAPKTALQDYFGYICPWNVALEVREPNVAGEGWDAHTKKWNLPRTRITFGLPTAPQIEEQLVAFAAYNDAGPTYLFTCC